MLSRRPAIAIFSFLLAICVSPALGQQSEGWTAHTSFGEGTDLSLTDSHVWISTEGGVYSIERSSGGISRLTVVDGLAQVGSSAISADQSRGVIWVGYDDGLMDRIDAETGEIRTFRDIERAEQYTARGINRITVQGDSLLIGTEFGVVVFDPTRNEVRDSYSRFGSLPVAMTVHDVYVETEVFGRATMWVATNEGIAHAPLNGLNLQDPASWSVERVGSGSDPIPVFSLTEMGGFVYAGAQADVYRRGISGTWQKLGVTNRAVTHLAASESAVVGSATFALVVVREDGSASSHSVDGLPFPVAASLEGSLLWLLDGANGLARASIPALDSGVLSPDQTYLPSGPADGSFSLLSMSEEGDVWASGVNAPNTGFYRLDTEGIWTSWSTLNTPELQGKAAFVHVFAGEGGVGWAGSEGAGVALVGAEGTVTLFTPANSSLLPALGSSDFVVVGGLHEDAFGNLWVTTRASSEPLHMRTPSGDWKGFGPKIGQGLLSTSTAYGRVFIDSFDEKWIVVHRETNFQQKRGLMVLDTGISENPSDDEFRFFGTKGAAGQGLPSVSVNAIAEDRDGLIWVGTESGPAYFINTGIVARDGSAIPIWPQWANRDLGTFMLFGLNIHDIAVDPAGRLWFGTDNGAWLVESAEGGYEVVYHFTSENSPLFSNEVTAVAVDDNSGQVYFSTNRGLVSFASDAIAPRAEAGDLLIYPNPVRVSGTLEPSIQIEGLVAVTDIRIVTPAGYLVRRLEARGGRTRWDGRDETGQLVDSGVYLVIAMGRNDEGTSIGKVAIIR